MKTINVTFEDGEHEKLKSQKGKDRSWRDWIIELAEVQDRNNKNEK